MSEPVGQPEIDFLPAKYREERTLRQTQGWRYGVLGLFVLLLCAALGLQQRTRFRLQAELAALTPQYEQAQGRTAELGILQAELNQARRRAELVAYLHHPWPRTQVLAAILEPLPSVITLTELTAILEVEPGRGARLQRAGASPGEKGSDKTELERLQPAEVDLRRLREEYDGKSLTITVSGTTSDVGLLYSYLSSIGAHPIVAKAELRSLQSEGAAAGTSTFSAKIVIRPGYGQPAGPRPAEPSSGDTVAAR